MTSFGKNSMLDMFETFDKSKHDKTNESSENKLGNRVDEAEEIDITKPYGLFMQGGSIGTVKNLTNKKGDLLCDTYDSMFDAVETAKRRNKQLTPGEKSYYRIKYYAAETKDVKGKNPRS